MAPPNEWIGGFSIASPPSNLPQLTLAIKKSNAQASTWVHTDSKVGSDLRVQVGGGCTLQEGGEDVEEDEQDDRPVVFCAGGIGISPVLGNYRYILDRQKKQRASSGNASKPPQSTTFLYSVSTRDELVFWEELIQLHKEQHEMDPGNKNRLIFALTKSDSWDESLLGAKAKHVGVELRQGRYLLELLESTPQDAIYYICGPPKMNDEAMDFLVAKGVRSSDIRYEKWW